MKAIKLATLLVLPVLTFLAGVGLSLSAPNQADDKKKEGWVDYDDLDQGDRLKERPGNYLLLGAIADFLTGQYKVRPDLSMCAFPFQSDGKTIESLQEAEKALDEAVKGQTRKNKLRQYNVNIRSLTVYDPDAMINSAELRQKAKFRGGPLKRLQEVRKRHPGRAACWRTCPSPRCRAPRSRAATARTSSSTWPTRRGSGKSPGSTSEPGPQAGSPWSTSILVTSVRLIAARHVLGLLTSDEIVRAADGLLAGGVYSHQLGEFATIREPIYSEVGPLFTAALKELQVPVPSREEAARTVAWYCLAGVAEGAVEPRDGLDRFMAELYQPLQFEEAKLLNSCGGSELAGWASEYEYLRVLAEEPHLDAGGAAVQGRAALDRQVVEFAVRWTRRHCPVRVDPAWLAWAGGTVTSLARSMREGRRFEDLPILADALEDAGCDDEEILRHCRVPGRHLNDCWLLDAILHGG